MAIVANPEGILYFKAHGFFTYGVPPPFNPTNPPVTPDTIFDMASLTKVLMSTSAIMTFYQRGELDLDWRVADPVLLGPAYAQAGKGAVTVRHLLLHSSGYPADPTPHQVFSTGAHAIHVEQQSCVVL